VQLAEVELRERALTPAVAAALTGAMEARQRSMAGHTERLAALSLEIGRRKGLAASELAELEIGAVLHDVGKIGIPDEILLKPGLIAPDERVVIETHPVIGDQMLRQLEQFSAVRLVVRHHHERWDGTGYPDRLAGADIPLSARIVAVADAVEAMCGERTYRPPLGRDDVLRELANGRGTQWDPELTDIVLDLVHRRQLRFGPAGMWLGTVAADA
jgi:HD-GYP domain-containing protein (c-di-GMP phosphodiesterase class II)